MNHPRTKKAKAFLDYLAANSCLFEINIDSIITKNEDYDSIVATIQPDVPSEPKHDIRESEEIEIRFFVKETTEPQVLVLRKDFPSLSHINPNFDINNPNSICLYDSSWQERMLSWTVFGFLERIFQWFRAAAEDRLHAENQPLEQRFINLTDQWVLKQSDIDKVTDSASFVTTRAIRLKIGENRYLWVGAEDDDEKSIKAVILSGTADTAPNGIQRTPLNLSELLNALGSKRDDFFLKLKSQLTKLRDDDESKFVILIKFRVSRTQKDVYEREDVWMFAFGSSPFEIGKKLGLCAEEGGMRSILLETEIPAEDALQRVQILPINVIKTLDRKEAAKYSGIKNTDLKIMLVGAGALGSQTHQNLEKSGWGNWHVLDKDYILPHNIVRHTATANDIGTPKAELASTISFLTHLDTATESSTCDILNPESYPKKLSDFLKTTDLIVDSSASATVSRFLSHNNHFSARCICGYVTASLNSLVILCESSDRLARLDWMEMLIYRCALNDNPISDYISSASIFSVYGNSCREKSVLISQDLIASFAATFSRRIRECSEVPEPVIEIFTILEDSSIKRESIEITYPKTIDSGNWKILFDEYVENRLHQLRSAELPNETGGILIGSFDLYRNIVYIVDILESPIDSKKSPIEFVRGIAGLKSNLDAITKKTGNQLQYVGEWHSHPVGCSANPSKVDKVAFSQLKETAQSMSHPALMVIVSDDKITFTAS